MKKFLFLDIDGVLNGYLRKDKEMHYLCDLCPVLIKRVRRIIDSTQCEVVLTTSWRFDEYIDKIMECCDIQYSDKTSVSWCRGQEIKNWLSEQKSPFTYCILEDSEELLPEQEGNTVRTSFNYGISEEQVQQAIKILNKSQKVMKNLVVLTGAGISAESGIPTFRNAVGSLWENYSIEEVCTAGCLKKDPEKVHDFYNMLRKKYGKAKPNAAHYALAELEKEYDVTIITQNVDNLHERAGSTHVIHLHGELMKCRDTGNTKYIYDIPQDENGEYNTHPGMTIQGRTVRPHVVFFGEDVPNLELAASYVKNADICVVIGTSFNVYPAAGLVQFVPYGNPIYYIDPNPAPTPDYPDIQVIKAVATKGVEELISKLKENE